MGFAAAEVRGDAHYNRLHQNPADVLHQPQRRDGGIGGAPP